MNKNVFKSDNSLQIMHLPPKWTVLSYHCFVTHIIRNNPSQGQSIRQKIRKNTFYPYEKVCNELNEQKNRKTTL